MKFVKQLDRMSCGPACIKMIGSYYGVNLNIENLIELSQTTRLGSSLRNLAIASENVGFRSLGVKISLNILLNSNVAPCILHWQNDHFVVFLEKKKNKYVIMDPAIGRREISEEDFLVGWIGANSNLDTEEGIALLLDPTPDLKNIDNSRGEKSGLIFLYSYLFKYKKFIFQIILGVFAGSLLQLVFPFLTQSIVDIGIQNENLSFIYLILLAQLLVFAGSSAIEIIRSWILLHLSTRLNISLISDFFIKLMNLPISFFDKKMTGDIIQRINDHKRIESLLTTQSLSVVFSLMNLFIFGAVLWWYNIQIFLVFFCGSLLYGLWVMLFLKKRKKLDYERFGQLSVEQSKVIELINGMQEIKLHNAEKEKRWGWEFIQTKLFKIETKSLLLEQTQSNGANIINELKNIFISILSATLVIQGEITLGMMMAISFIIGQLNTPILQLISFIYTLQDAKIALERLSEIHNKDNEETDLESKITDVSTDDSIELKNVYFKYLGSQNNILEDLTLSIKSKKITAIVGASGSGKTTLMKMLLKFYEPNSGEIKIGGNNLNNVSQSVWRELCGVVMQEGYIFNDTIANNIAIGQDRVDHKKLIRAVEVANIKEFIDELPLGFNTKIGMEGVGMSTGQKQRLLIARAVYKNPEIICFDEATSALDAKNERVIMENLNEFFKDRTAIVIAHRLSTVKNADQIVVLDEGKIKEKGTHNELIALKGSYFNLVKNQLQLEKLN